MHQELLRKQVPVGKHRFSLATLLLIPLVVSPIFLALRDSLTMIARRWNGFGIEICGLGFTYALALTVISYRRQKTSGTLTTKRIFVWSLLRGTLFGILFFFLACFPVMVTEQVVVYKAPRPWTMRFLHLSIDFGVVVLFGGVIGAAAGGILGLFLPRSPDITERRPTEPKQQPSQEGSGN
jgi:hypothetical protein